MKAIDYGKHKMNIVQVALNVVVLTVSEKCTSQLKASLSEIDSLRYGVQGYAGNQPLKKHLNEPFPDVVILELVTSNDEILRDIQRFVENNANKTEVLVTLPNADMQTVKRLVQSGVVDILSQPISHQELLIALSSTQARQASSAKDTKTKKGVITSFMSTHASAGGNFVALNVAYQLAAFHKKRTVLVDMDIQFGTVASELDIKTDGNLLEALRDPDRIDEVFLDALIVNHSSGLDILSSPGDLSATEYLSAEAVTRLITVLRKSYEHIVINPPLYVNDAVEQVFRLSNPVYLVTQDTLSTLRNLKMIMQRLPLRGVPAAHIEVIHNRLDKSAKMVNESDLKKLIGDCRLHSVHNDYKLAAQADNAGKAVSELYPNTKLVRDIRSIASGIVDTDAVSEPSTKRGFLQWIS